MKQSSKNTASIVINAVIFLWTVLSVLGCLFSIGVNDPEVQGTKCFRFFTIDSNILCGLAAITQVIARLKQNKISRGVVLFKFVGTCAVTVTFLTVVFFLGPTMGYLDMIEGHNLYMHVVGPILAILSFCLIEKEEVLTNKEILLGVIPTAVYACVYLVMVLALGKQNGGWSDFYGFNEKGRWYISLPVMLLATYLISFILTKLHNKKALQ